MSLRTDADYIIQSSIHSVLPDAAVEKALKGRNFSGKIVLVAFGKAAWQMAHAAYLCIGEKIQCGIVITKYDHVNGPIGNLECYEAGHPVPDANSFSATERALEMVQGLTAEDTVILLISGGGSALFEKPLIDASELQSITDQLLAAGANIVEMNTVRKRLSAVKGGKFALACNPARVYSIILSDIIGDPLDMIASGPAAPDSSTAAQARDVIKKYHINISEDAFCLLNEETPKKLDNVETTVSGSVSELCLAAAQAAAELGYEPEILTDRLSCEASDAGLFLGSIAKTRCGTDKPLTFIVGGETVVHLKGSGKGGRNQEMALSAATEIDGLSNVVFFSVGSDGTDGPTDAAGGIVDGMTCRYLAENNINAEDVLLANDSYHALDKVGCLIRTGPTGTNVNDLSVVLISPVGE